MADSALERALSPVEEDERPEERKAIEKGPALALSGGGYRAMLFHLGGLIRLNEVHLLGTCQRVSCVSGGSITGGLLGLRWKDLRFQNGRSALVMQMVVDPIRGLASKTVDRGAIIGGVLLPGAVWERVRDAYKHYLFGEATLQDLPEDQPRIVLNATNVQSGCLWRFMRPYMRDWKVGEYLRPTLSLATAVAASSAFPPVLSPVTLKLDPSKFTQGTWIPGFEDPAFREEVMLSDGGVYDNLGVETIWKRYETIFVSDGGGQLAAEIEPHEDWARHALRINGLIDSQVRKLRKRQVIGSLMHKVRKGAYWSIHVDPSDANWAPHFALPCNRDRARELAQTPTRLARLDGHYQERIINWGYAVGDAALRAFFDKSLPKPQTFPFEGAGV
ncbi:MAG: patatin-like phospholipase family protein [Thermoanaerobaculia bacterium]|nr:patatin-like phospholipase family protein [Thermoanaerobaculia bacterium]